MPDKTQKLKDLLNLFNEGLTREEFLDAFKKILEIIVQIKNQNQQAVSAIEQTYGNLLGKVDTEKKSTLNEIRNEAKTKLAELLKTSQEKLWSLDLNFSTQKEGIISEALSRVPPPEPVIIPPPETPEQILEKITGLLEIKDIKDLQKALDDLKATRRLGGGGGFGTMAFNSHFIHDETPTNSGDNLNFTLLHAPSPANSLKLYRGGARQRVGATKDFTLSGRTITLLLALTGEELLVDYNI